MKLRLVVLGIVLGALAFAPSANAAPLTVSYSTASGDLAASATFDNIGGGILQVTLSNVSTFDALVPTDILTALFFDIGSVDLTPVSATLAGGSALWNCTLANGCTYDTNVGGEWAYADGLSGVPGGGTSGISSTGLGLFGSGNFNGFNLQGPVAVNGGQFGITSFGDNPATGNTPLQTEALIHYSVVFTLSGISASFDPSTAISDVAFQYGTSLGETTLVPEPTSMLLFGVGLLGMGLLRRRRS